MSKRNKERLAGIAGVLLPLGLQESVQKDVVSHDKPYEQTLFYKANQLNMYAMNMFVSFLNNGVQRIGYSEPFWRDRLPFES